MKFAPPRVNYKRPDITTFVAFLQSRGWSVDRKWGGFLLMKPPAEIKALDDPDFRYYLPAAGESRGYDEMVFHAVENFAELYNIPLQELFDVLSESIPDLQKEVERQPKQLKMKKAILASA